MQKRRKVRGYVLMPKWAESKEDCEEETSKLRLNRCSGKIIYEKAISREDFKFILSNLEGDIKPKQSDLPFPCIPLQRKLGIFAHPPEKVYSRFSESER